MPTLTSPGANMYYYIYCGVRIGFDGANGGEIFGYTKTTWGEFFFVNKWIYKVYYSEIQQSE